MNNAIRLTSSFLMIITLSALAFGSEVSEKIDLAQFAGRPEALVGRVIEIDAQVIAINADGKSLELFDTQSRTRVLVKLDQLRKADRLALMQGGARSVSVSGRASVVAGLLTIDAETLRPLPATASASTPESETQQTEVVPLAILN